MSRDVNRRRFLVAAGGAVALAGCVGRAGEYVPGGGSTPSPFEEDGDDDGAADDEHQGLADDGDAEDDEDETQETRFPAVEDGELLDDFEDLSAWSINVGEGMDADSSEWVRGSQSMRVESTAGGDTAGVFAIFSDGLDLEGRHLSMALKVEAEGRARITTELHAPGSTNRLRADRTIVSDLDDWIRIDVGYTGRDGAPDLSSVEELRVTGRASDGEIRFWIDDLRVTDADEAPKAVLVFDNVLESHYERVYPMLDNRGVGGVVPAAPQFVGGAGRLTIDQLREMRDAGWDVATRPAVSESLPGLSADEQREAIEGSKQFLEGRGFPEGSRHFFPHGSSMDGTTVEIVQETHETSTTFGGCPNANPPITRHTASRFSGEAGDSTRRLLELASDYGQSVILSFGEVGGDGSLSTDEFEELLEEIEERGFEIVSLSELHGI